MLDRYANYLKFNKNILFAFAASITLSAIFAQSVSDQENYLNTTYTLIVDYLIFFSTFGGLFYFDNRKKYRLESGKVDNQKLKHDLLKIITSLGISEIIYTIIRWVSQYYFLTINYDPYLASIISQSISTVVYMIVINMSIKLTRLYKNDS